MNYLKIEYYGTTFSPENSECTLGSRAHYHGTFTDYKRSRMRTNAPFYVVQSSLSAHIFLLVYILQFNWYVAYLDVLLYLSTMPFSWMHR